VIFEPDASQGARVVDTLLQQVVVPGFTAFAAASASLTEASEALCRQPEAKQLSAARDRWRAAMVGWNRVLPYRFGPMKEGFPRSLEWQIDTALVPGGVRAASIRAALAHVVKAESPIDLALVARHKLFASGLNAIGLMLYEDLDRNWEEAAVIASLRGPVGSRKCAYLAAMSAQTQGLAEQLAAGWRDFGAAPRAGAADLNLYDELINQCIALLDFVERRRVRALLARRGAESTPAKTGIHDVMLAMVRANVEGVNATMTAGDGGADAIANSEQVIQPASGLASAPRVRIASLQPPRHNSWRIFMAMHPNAVSANFVHDLRPEAAEPGRREICVMGFLNSTLAPPPRGRSSEDLAGRVRTMLRWYAQRRSRFLALVLVEYLDQLREQDSLGEAPRLARLWQQLADARDLALTQDRAWRTAARPLLWPQG
jgi:predicted lipoprotein